MKKQHLPLARIVAVLFSVGAMPLTHGQFAAENDPFVKKKASQVDDPFGADDPGDAGPRHPWESQEVQVGILVEWIEADSRTANKLVRKHAGSKEVGNAELREELEEMIDGGEATLMHFDFVKTRSGQRAKVVSADEVVYATEYDSPQVSQNLTLTDATQKATAPNPRGFETRDAGGTFEVDPVVGADKKIIELNMAPEWTTFEGRDYSARESSENVEITDVWKPKFFTLTTTTAVVTRDGIPVLVSVHRPKAEGKTVLLFVQANIVL